MKALAVFLLMMISADPSEEDKKKYEEAARNAINGTAGAIDACTARYLEEQPGTDGSAKISIKIGKGGVVVAASVDTTLTQPRSLKECLERIARGWKLPPPQTDQPDDLSLQIPVKKGYKFKIYAPGEQKPPEAATQPEGFMQFTPQFLRNYG